MHMIPHPACTCTPQLHAETIIYTMYFNWLFMKQSDFSQNPSANHSCVAILTEYNIFKCVDAGLKVI